MKRSELRPCDLCGEKHNPLDPTIYEITIGPQILDMHKLGQYAGMEMFFGGHVGIANVMMGDGEVPKALPQHKFFCCAACFDKPMRLNVMQDRLIGQAVDHKMAEEAEKQRIAEKVPEMLEDLNTAGILKMTKEDA